MASEVLLNIAKPKQVSSTEKKKLKDMEQIKALIITSEKVLDNYDIAKKLRLAPDYVEKLCFDIYDGMIIKERQDEEVISDLEMIQWLKENDCI